MGTPTVLPADLTAAGCGLSFLYCPFYSALLLGHCPPIPMFRYLS